MMMTLSLENNIHTNSIAFALPVLFLHTKDSGDKINANYYCLLQPKTEDYEHK